MTPDERKKLRDAYLMLAEEAGKLSGPCGLGLCAVLGMLREAKKIDDASRAAIAAEIIKLPQLTDGSAFKWPLSEEGKAQRIAWCRAKAAELAEPGVRCYKSGCEGVEGVWVVTGERQGRLFYPANGLVEDSKAIAAGRCPGPSFTEIPIPEARKMIHPAAAIAEFDRITGAEPPPPAEPKPAPDQPPPNKYLRTIRGWGISPEREGKRDLLQVDVYDVLRAFNVTDPALQHAIKKLLMPGERGAKDRATDLREAIDAIRRAE